MTDDEFDKIRRDALMKAEIEELGPVWDSVPLGGAQPLPERLERIWRLTHPRQEEEEKEPPGGS